MRRLGSVAVAGLMSLIVLRGNVPHLQAQEDKRVENVFRANIRFVSVDVVAVDHSERPVSDLSQNDFTVIEDGKPQKLSSFAFHSQENESTATKPGPLLQAHVTTNRPELRHPDAPAIVLLLDGLNTASGDQIQVKQQMLRYLAAHYNPQFKIAVLTLSGELHILQDFTSDPQLLKAALERYRALIPAAARVGGERDVTETIQQMPIVSEHAGSVGTQSTLDPSVPRGNGGANATIAEKMAYQLQHFENEVQNFARDQRVSITLTALQNIARYMEGQKGRKSVLWFSAGFPITVSGFDAADLDTSRGYADQVRKTTDLLSEAHIAIYTIDARGLVGSKLGDITDPGLKGRIAGPELNRALETETYQRFNEEETMERVARDTGGQFFRDNDLVRAIEMSARDTSTYYLLGYYPTDRKWDGRFRKIQVKVNRPGVRLQYRSGYFANDPRDWRKAGGEDAMAAAMKTDPLIATEVLFFARALPPAAKSDLKVEFLVDPRTISFETASENQRYCNLQFEVQSFGQNGKLVKAEVQTAQAPLRPETFDRVQKQGIPMSMEIKLPPGHYNLKLGVRDNQTGLFGTAELQVDIPSS